MLIGLTEAKRLFALCQKRGAEGFIVRRHCWMDHPERGFSQLEVLNLLLAGGALTDNRYPSAKEGSFIWKCKDSASRNVEIVVLFSEDGSLVSSVEVKLYSAVAISAHRKGGSKP